ncbi:hypothetical protein EXS45_00320 [Candidatus Nomurabacteria bacterium]|nr:hypothetical protein [Candidatus Nomurabacteria bacterium]
MSYVLTNTRGKISTAASIVGITHRTLFKKVKYYDLVALVNSFRNKEQHIPNNDTEQEE